MPTAHGVAQEGLDARLNDVERPRRGRGLAAFAVRLEQPRQIAQQVGAPTVAAEGAERVAAVLARPLRTLRGVEPGLEQRPERLIILRALLLRERVAGEM